MSAAKQQKQENKGFQWDQYWSLGNIHSLSNAFDGNYTGGIEDFWTKQFLQLKDGAHILDIGTGNGAVAFIAAGVAKQRDIVFHVHAIDLAKIDPVKATESHPELSELLPYIDFKGQISASNLPFEDNQFDMVVGQFALEYTPIESTLVEIKRTLKGDGSMNFIMHHQDSIIMRTTRDELLQAKLIFEDSKLFLRARSLVKVMGDADTAEKRLKLQQNKSAERKRNNLNQALAELQQQAESREDPSFLLTAMNYVIEIFKSKSHLPMKQKIHYLQQSEDLIKGNQQRIQDLYDACFNESKSIQFCELCKNNGFGSPEFNPFYNENNQLIGYTMICKTF